MKKKTIFLLLIIIILLPIYSCSVNEIDKKLELTIKENIEEDFLSGKWNESKFNEIFIFDSPGRFVFLRSEKKKIRTGIRTFYYFAGYLPVKVKVMEDAEIQGVFYKKGLETSGRIYFQSLLSVNEDDKEKNINTKKHQNIRVFFDSYASKEAKQEASKDEKELVKKLKNINWLENL